MMSGIQRYIGLTHAQLNLFVEQRHHRHRLGHAAIDTDSDTVPPDVRFLQYQLHEGPCLDAVRWQETVISRNLSEEARWPEWTPRAVSVLGIEAIMSLWLDTSLNPDGADSYGAPQSVFRFD
jgi:hypothetical protein